MSIYYSPVLVKMLQEERLREIQEASRAREAHIREARDGSARRPAFADSIRRLFVRRPAAATDPCTC